MFEPTKETIFEYIKRKVDAYDNKRVLLRELRNEGIEGIEDWTISKIVRNIHSPTLDKVQPLFSYFVKQDEAKKKRSRDGVNKKVTSH